MHKGGAMEHHIDRGCEKKGCTPAALKVGLRDGPFHIGVVRADRKNSWQAAAQAGTPFLCNVLVVGAQSVTAA